MTLLHIQVYTIEFIKSYVLCTCELARYDIYMMRSHFHNSVVAMELSARIRGVTATIKSKNWRVSIVENGKPTDHIRQRNNFVALIRDGTAVWFPFCSGRRKKADKTRANARFSRLVTSQGRYNETCCEKRLDFSEHVRDHEISERAAEINAHSHVYYITFLWHVIGIRRRALSLSPSLFLSVSARFIFIYCICGTDMCIVMRASTPTGLHRDKCFRKLQNYYNYY